MKLSISQILESTGGKLLQDSNFTAVSSISTDSRTLESGDLFICLSGPNFDGHQYIEQVIEKKAAGIIIQNSKWNREKFQNRNCFFIGVEDCLKALGDLARFWRRQFTIPLVAITGSNGKTTTKDLVSKILGQQYKTLATEGNLNNLIGVPKMLFKLDSKHTAAVIEMGMNDFGEIRRLSEIAEPTVGLITNIGYAHIEKLKSLEGIAKAKGELFEVLPPGTIALVNQDDPYISHLPTRAYKISYGIEKPADVTCTKSDLTDEGIEFEIRHLGKDYSFTSSLFGLGNLKNLVAAVAVGFALGIDPKKIQTGIDQFAGREMRMEILHLRQNISVLNDCYNANPTSTQMAIETLALLKKDQPGLAILGEMLEMGDFSVEGHRRVGKAVAQNRIGYLMAIGTHATEIIKGATDEGMKPENCLAFQNQDEIKEILFDWAKKSKIILIKGSRGAKMEKVTEKLKTMF